MDDMVKLYTSSLTDKRLSGPINATAPNPVTMKELSRTIGRVLKRPSWFPVPFFLAKLVIGESAQVVATGQRVVPQKILSVDFPFSYRNVEEALRASLL
jgi:NAD dependent epimerase/dehydratase family enzyme